MKKAMLLSDYDCGKPLTARRILAVKQAIDANGVAKARSARIQHETFRSPEVRTAALGMGYMEPELRKLARAAHFYAEAKGVSEMEAMREVGRPGSEANRLMNYGGRFLKSASNFQDGLRLLSLFSDWHDGLSRSLADRNAPKDTPTKRNLDVRAGAPDAKLGLERFLFEDIAVNPGFDLGETDPERAFGVEHNTVGRFMTTAANTAMLGTLVNVPPKQRRVVAAAFNACGADPDVRAIVMDNLDLILVGANAALRSEASVRRTVEGLAANFTDLRQLSAHDPELLAQGMDMLAALHGKSLPPGVLRSLVQAAWEQPTEDLRGLSGRSRGMAIHKVVARFFQNVDRAATESGAMQALDGADELAVCRDFIVRRMLSTLRPADVQGLHAALHSQNAARLSRTYGRIADFAGNGFSEGMRSALFTMGQTLRSTMVELNRTLAIHLGREYEPIEELDGDPPRPETFGVLLDPHMNDLKARFEGDIAEQGFDLSLDSDGNLAVVYTSRQVPTAAVFGAERIPCGPGSEVKGKLEILVNVDDLEQFANQDFAKYDDQPANRVLNVHKPDDKFGNAYFAIPQPFRLRFDVVPGLVADLK